MGADKIYESNDPEMLNKLAMLMPEYRTEFNTTLMPDNTEFIEGAEKARKFRWESPEIPELDRALEKKQLTEDQEHTFLVLELCEKYNVLPFFSLKFDYRHSDSAEPEIEYAGHNFGSTTCRNPIYFTRESKWYSISFEDFADPESIKRAKLAIARFIEQGYRVTGLSGKVEPSTRRGDHCTVSDDKGYFFSNGRRIIVFGKPPQKFEELDFENLPDLKSPSPEPPKLLKALVNSIKEKQREKEEEERYWNPLPSKKFGE